MSSGMNEIVCAECGKPEDDTKHVKYGPDEESVAMGMKHHFVEPTVTLARVRELIKQTRINTLVKAQQLVGDSESLSGALARIRDLILKVQQMV